MRIVRKNLTIAYGTIAAAYKALARTAEIRARFDVEMGQALGDMPHRHMESEQWCAPGGETGNALTVRS